MNNKILDVCCTNELDFKFDHFKDVNELLENIDTWFINDDIDYTRWFGLNDLHTLKAYINKLQKENQKLKEDIRKDEVYFKTFELAEECDQKQDIIDIYELRIKKSIEKAQELKNHIDKSGFDGMTKSILIMAVNEIIYILNKKEVKE